jgi:hypothetical protein
MGAPDYIPFSTAPVTVSRDIGEESASPAPAGSAGSASASAAPAAAPAGGEVDVDEIADTVIDKLRREMLIERELGGGAMDLI